MPEPAPADHDVAEALEAILDGRLTARALVEASLARIEATDGDLRAWVTVDVDGALAAADARDAELAAGRAPGALHGIPIGIKDIIDVAGMPTTAGAAPFAHTHPTRDATLVARLRAAGAVIVGKTVATEFAFKDPAATRNPWSAAHTPGGSSSGSAAAVAARQVPAAIGTQTVGSILRPAAYCGVVGFKGVYGAVPLDGVLPLASSLDHAGPIARSVADAARIEAILEGGPIEGGPIEGGPLDGVPAARPPRLAVGRDLMDRAGSGLRDALVATVARFAEGGADVVSIDLPASFAGILDAGRIVLETEAAATHAAWFAEHAAEYGPGIAGLILAGQGRSRAELAAASSARAAFATEMAPILASVDALLAPVAPGPAPVRAAGTGDFSLCAPWSFIGVPAISIPMGLDATGLPLAIQLVGAAEGPGRLLRAAAWAEALLGTEARPSPSRGGLPA